MRRAGPSAAETPLLRVSRPVSACSRCRAAKIKCDGKLPACTACEKSGRANECSSANDQFAKGKERSYVASLESRVDKLERRIAYARSRKASVAMHDVGDTPSEASDRKDSLATIRAAIHGKAAKRREAADVSELVSDFGFLSVNATTRDFDASTTSMTFARLVLAATNIEEVPEPDNFQLPPRPAATRLVQYYLDNVFALYPVFSETALFNALDAVYQRDGRPVTDFEYWLFYMVMAIATSSQSRSKLDVFYTEGVRWLGRALVFADQVLIPGYVSQIQALILLVQYSMIDPAHFDSWLLIGFASRAVVDLGFHQDPPKEQQLDKTLDMRRRVFYCVYSLDRSISMVYARAFSFTDDSASVAFPASRAQEMLNAKNTWPAAGPYATETSLLLFELRRANSIWYQELFQSSHALLPQGSNYVWQMCNEMREWSQQVSESLPSTFKDFFDLELLYSYIYCLSPSSRVPVIPDHAKALIFEYCIAYMQKILSICKEPLNVACYTYHDALRVYFIGSQFLAVMSENRDQLLSGTLSAYASQDPFPQQPPPVPLLRTAENADRSFNCIHQVRQTLQIFGERWDNSILRASFDTLAQPLLAVLDQQRHKGERPVAGQEQIYLQQPAYDQLEGLVSGGWANVNPMYMNPTGLGRMAPAS